MSVHDRYKEGMQRRLGVLIGRHLVRVANSLVTSKYIQNAWQVLRVLLQHPVKGTSFRL